MGCKMKPFYKSEAVLVRTINSGFGNVIPVMERSEHQQVAVGAECHFWVRHLK